ncbi:hypothetical protein BZG01_10830 [Labilibaculum manganireducens]|uniref:Uncharacterized protein n=1 Tax=Labilibaculum manganireducens TaxID=1940525 RepID=A0A2N3I8E2_9BACT|nr:hypothetical protein BZG01_10830 [Labilibaculum manganireducens]
MLAIGHNLRKMVAKDHFSLLKTAFFILISNLRVYLSGFYRNILQKCLEFENLNHFQISV